MLRHGQPASDRIVGRVLLADVRARASGRWDGASQGLIQLL